MLVGVLVSLLVRGGSARRRRVPAWVGWFVGAAGLPRQGVDRNACWRGAFVALVRSSVVLQRHGPVGGGQSLW